MFWASSIPTKAITFNFSSLASTLLPFYFGSRQHSWSPTDSETSFSVSSVRNPHIGTSLPGSLTCYSRRQYFQVSVLYPWLCHWPGVFHLSVATVRGFGYGDLPLLPVSVAKGLRIWRPVTSLTCVRSQSLRYLTTSASFDNQQMDTHR